MIEGERDEALLVRLTAPPVDSAANEQLIATLASALQLPRTRLSIAGGEHGRQKRILVRGVTAAQLRERLSRIVPT
jgi:uncharacterized protein YggU (UPF0235/DUF167 family)